MSRLASTLAPTLVRTALLALSLVYGTGCNSHPLTSPDAGPQIGDRGISVPVPPPSLKLAPVQRVDIEGEIGATAGEPGTRVFLSENRLGTQDYNNMPEDNGSFFFTGIELDLTDNCVEVWTEDGDGNSSVHSFFRASIDEDDQSVLTEQLFNGCP
ncbi:MAG: hypothetical protein H0T76_10775 [Nannocystis sp.]|nr:hypothetical protein [Nannocystis sp.]MBA3546956.1 hypothetical protein [Nannocystis sp.]